MRRGFGPFRPVVIGDGKFPVYLRIKLANPTDRNRIRSRKTMSKLSPPTVVL